MAFRVAQGRAQMPHLRLAAAGLAWRLADRAADQGRRVLQARLLGSMRHPDIGKAAACLVSLADEPRIALGDDDGERNRGDSRGIARVLLGMTVSRRETDERGRPRSPPGGDQQQCGDQEHRSGDQEEGRSGEADGDHVHGPHRPVAVFPEDIPTF
jgi:hypothetical protein